MESSFTIISSIGHRNVIGDKLITRFIIMQNSAKHCIRMIVKKK